MPTFETLLKLITEKWDLLLAVIVLLGGTGLVGGLLQWRARQRQRRRQRQIPAGDFPFEVIPPNSPDVVQRLMPPQGLGVTDPLADFNIPYLERIRGRTIRRELEDAFHDKPWVLIVGRTGLGKTREAAHLAALLNREGWTVLKLTDQGGGWLDEPRQFPTDKINSTDKLLFFLDDLNHWMYRGNPRELYKEADDPTQPLRVPVQERLLKTLRFFERECRADVRVIATARNESTPDLNRPDQPSEWAKLQLERYPQLWQRFVLYELTEPEAEAITALLENQVQAAAIPAKTAELPQIARRNDGTFRNVVENLRSARSRRLELSLATATETLDRTWHQRYKAVVRQYPAAQSIYGAIAVLQSLNLALHPILVEHTARLRIQQRGIGWVWQVWQLRRALRYLIRAEQILQPRDGQIEASGQRPDLTPYITPVLNLLIQLRPHYPVAMLVQEFFDLGNALAQLSHYEAAIASYDHAIEIKPDLQAPWFNRGNALVALDSYKEALASYNQALQLQPDDHQAWTNRGFALAKLGRHKDAIASYDQALQLKPDDYQAWINRGATLVALACYNKANSSYDRALQLIPDKHDAWHGRGLVLTLLGRYEEAISSFDQALQLKPDKHDAWYGRGVALILLGRIEEAIFSFNQALQLKPDMHEVWYAWGLILDRLGSYEKAIASYDRALEIQPDDDQAWYKKACCYALWGKVDAALDSLQRAIELNPDNREQAGTDADFDGIRQDKRFQALLGQQGIV